MDGQEYDAAPLFKRKLEEIGKTKSLVRRYSKLNNSFLYIIQSSLIEIFACSCINICTLYFLENEMESYILLRGLIFSKI